MHRAHNHHQQQTFFYQHFHCLTVKFISGKLLRFSFISYSFLCLSLGVMVSLIFFFYACIYFSPANRLMNFQFYFYISASSKSVDRSSSLFGWRGARGGSLSPSVSMATPSCILRDCTHPNLNETIKSHNATTFKLVKTGE